MIRMTLALPFRLESTTISDYVFQGFFVSISFSL